MHDNRDDFEPIIADRRSRGPQPEETQPLWRIVIALVGGLAVAVLIGWWLMGTFAGDGVSPTAAPESTASELQAEEHIEQAPAPPAQDLQPSTEVAQPTTPPASAAQDAAVTEQAIPESDSEVRPNEAPQSAATPASVSVKFMSPDSQVQFELHGPLASSPVLTNKPGDVVDVAPGRYRVVASGAQLETFEQEVKFDGERPMEYAIELCAERKFEHENLAGQVVEERTCASKAQCESMFAVLSEQAEAFVRDRAFRSQQCAKWRPKAAPSGKWTLDTDCGGATLTTTCRIEIAQGACTYAEPRRSVRGTACPRVELR